MASIVTVASVCCTRVISSFHVGSRSRRGVRAGSLPSEDSAVLSSEIAGVSGASFIEEKGKIGHGISGGNGRLVSKVDDGRLEKEKDKEKDILEPLWDDGYGTGSVKDYLDIAREMIKPDGGPPRWFCPVDCGRPMKDSPLLLFLPGMDGVGFGLVSHHRALGKVFEVRCMHIPVYDRTSFEGLVEFVESTIRREHSLSPNKPIYIVGDSFGGCLALAVAARNPTIDLILILSNPATSFGKSQLQPLLPILEGLPDGLDRAVPFLLSFIMGDPVKMAMINVENRLPPVKKLEQLSENLVALLQRLSVLSDIIPRETLLWKLKLLKSAAAYSNSRLHAVKAEVLLLASGKDNMLPSGDEAKRLSNTLQNCTVRFFMDDGHTLLMEDGVNLLTVIKGTNFYRRSRQHDHVSDFIPPSITEFHYLFDQPDGIDGLLRFATCPVMLSTLEDGKVVRGLQGVPDDGPVLLIGYHMLMGLELSPLVEAFLREKKVMVRGVAHPSLFMIEVDSSLQFSRFNWLKVFGAIPASARNLFKLLSTKSYALLYPGGAREALHRKGEEYKLFWPDQPEFVRMAARFGATIIPFGVIGEDDIAELVLDYNDIMRIPLLGDWVRERNKIVKNIRADSSGEVVNQDLFLPGVLPKIPGRFYYLFGKPIKTKGMEEQLKNRANANELYLQVKSEIERMIAFLQKKREEDPYRGIVERTIYRAVSAPVDQVPTFDP